MANIAPMLAHFGEFYSSVVMGKVFMIDVSGYDPDANPPNYGKADKVVIDNTNDIKSHDDEWEEIAEKVKSLSKKDTMPRGSKNDEIKDFDQ